jgi:hypothetical protein
MADEPLTADEIRAAADVHRELGPEYGDAVVESFLARIDRHIEARVDQRLGSVAARPPKAAPDPLRLARYRSWLAASAIGTAVGGLPLSLLAAWALSHSGDNAKPLLVVWVVLIAVYGLAAYKLRRR